MLHLLMSLHEKQVSSIASMTHCKLIGNVQEEHYLPKVRVSLYWIANGTGKSGAALSGE